MPKVHFVDGAMALASSGQVFVADFGRPLTRTAVRQVRASVVDAARGGKLRVMGVFELSGFALRDLGQPGSREELRALASEEGALMHAVAVVIEGQGLLATTIRSTAPAVAMFSRASFPLKLFASTGAGAEFLAADAPADRALIVEVAAAARAARVHHGA